DELKAIEGADGIYWRYCNAVSLIRQARKNRGQEGLKEAKSNLEAVASRRSAWPPLWIARADLEDLLSNSDQAIENYRRAIELGERKPRVVRQLVEQLYKRQRFDEAEQEIRRLQKQAPSTDLTRLLVDISIRRQDFGGAASQALDAVPADSSDYRDHLWLGQVLAASGERSGEAEKHLRRAVELGGDMPETWLFLVQFLVNAEQKEKAEAVLAELCSLKATMQAYFTKALCQEALGQLDKAQENFQKALTAQPDDLVVLR